MRGRPHTIMAYSAYLLFVLSATTTAFAKKIPVVEGIPAGFETLAAPRTTVVTLYYGGELIGNLPAKFTDSTLAFTDPSVLLAALPDVADKVAIGAALSSPLPTHPELLCGKRPREGCGQLEPTVAGIIFDEAQLSAELFIQRDLLATAEKNAVRYLPLPERHFSSVSRFNGAVSGTGSGNPNYTLGNHSIFSLGEGSLSTATTLTNRGVRFDTVSADIERQGIHGSLGLIRSLPMQLAGDRDIAGLTLNTSLRTRIDARKTEGNAIILYLPRQSFVSIYREGRLYSSRNYEAGNQQIDTSELPNGAYNITLRIQEVGGVAREETRFFAKSEQIPPPDAPTYYLQAGVIREPLAQDETMPQLTSAPLLRAGTVHRVAENMGLGIGLLGLSDRAAVEPGIFLLTDNTQLRATGLASSASDYGLQSSLLYIRPDWSANLDARKLWVGNRLSPEYIGLLNAITQATGSATYQLAPDIALTFRASYIETEAMPPITSIGPALTWRLWQEGESLLYFSADAARTGGREQATALLQFSYRLGHYGVSGQSGYSQGSNAPGAFGSVRGWYNHSTPDEALIAGINLRHDSRADSIGGDADWRTRIGHFNGSVQRSIGTQNSTSYGGSFAIGAAQAEDRIALGGSEANMSAVMVEATGDANGNFLIEINGTPRGTITAGERRVIYLTPYNSYRIRLTATAGSSMVHIEGGEQKITLYPGNVTPVTWQLHPFHVVVARILSSEGGPLANAALTNSREQAATNEKGYLQVELQQPTQLQFTQQDGSHCTVQLPPETTAVHGVLLYHTPLTCRPE